MPDEQTGFQRLGRFVLLKRLAAGGMAEIHLARHFDADGFAKPLAIKRSHQHLGMNERFVNMFLDEARIAARLNHPNIVQIFELGRVSGYPFIAMEYIEGISIRDLLRRARKKKAPMPWELIARIGARMCEALEHAHNLAEADGSPINLVHRDVSPQNVLLSFDGTPKLVDFGIARASVRVEETQSFSRKGKLRYMSPEQVLGLDLDHKSDMFSLGVVLWELLSGRRLFDSEGELGVLKQITEDPIPRIKRKTLPDGFRRAIDGVLERESEDRFDATTFGQALDEVAREAEQAPSAKRVASYIAEVLGDEVEQSRNEVKQLMALDLSQEVIDDASPAQAPLGWETPSGPFGVTPTFTGSHPPAPAPVSPVRRWLAIGLGAVAVVLLSFLGAKLAAPDAVSAPAAEASNGVGSATSQDEVVGVADGSAPLQPLPEPPPPPLAPEPAKVTKAVASGSLVVKPSPSDARVSIDGKKVRANETLQLEAGTHTVRAERSGYRSASQRITLGAGKSETVRLKLKANPAPTGYLTFNTVPWSTVYLGKKKLGQTTPLVKIKLPAGKHNLTVLPEGKAPSRKVEVDIKAGKLTRKSLRL